MKLFTNSSSKLGLEPKPEEKCADLAPSSNCAALALNYNTSPSIKIELIMRKKYSLLSKEAFPRRINYLKQIIPPKASQVLFVLDHNFRLPKNQSYLSLHCRFYFKSRNLQS